jgi:YHYH protein
MNNIKRFLGLSLLMAWSWSLAMDQYDGSVLSIDQVQAGATVYNNVKVTISRVVSVGQVKLNSNLDLYDPTTLQVYLAQVGYAGVTYSNVVVAVDKVISVGSSMSASTTASNKIDLCTYADSGQQTISYQKLGSSQTVSLNLPYNFTWSCGASRNLVGNGVPNHSTTGGSFATDLSTQSVTQSFSLTPTVNTNSTKVAPSGFAVNSVKLDPGTAGTCLSSASSSGVGGGCDAAGNGGPWIMEALGNSSPWIFGFGTDSSNGHVQPNGQYHYHGMPNGLITKLNASSSSAMTLVGLALDGFPIYARYGYANAMDPNSALKVMTGSYQTKSTPDSGRPSVSIFPMGAFTQDWQYVANSGDLDECNGRFGVTPEYPKGIYHYFITDTYPFIQRCVKGTPSATTQGSGPGSAPGPGPGSVPPMGPPPMKINLNSASLKK